MAIQYGTGFSSVAPTTTRTTTTAPLNLFQRTPTLEDQVRTMALWGGKPSSYSPYVSTLPKIAIATPTTSGGGGGGSGTGVFRGFRGLSGTKEEPAPDVPLNWNDILARAQAPYDALTAQLRALAETERGNIAQATGQAVNALGSVDPLAAYRETYQAAQAAPAASIGYLNAIGASPAQVEAQRNLGNQLLAAQTASQQGFGSAVDQANANYRLAQLSEAYLNQQRALAGVGASAGAQEAAIGLAATQQRNELARTLLETQLQLLTMAAQGQFDKIKPEDIQPSLSWASQFLGMGA